LARARQVVGKVRASASLAKPHPLVARLLADDEKRREKQKSIPYASSFYAPIFESPFEKRRLRFMNGLLLAVARAGGRASLRGKEGRAGRDDRGYASQLHPRSTQPPPAAYPPKQLPANEKMKLELGWYEPPPEIKILWAEADGPSA